MARKASDLLDVFRLRPEGSGDTSAPKRTSGGKSAKKDRKPRRKTSARARNASDVVVSLSRRQSVYAGCVLVLLLALSFTLGVSLSGDETAAEPTLRRDTAKIWYILGELPGDSSIMHRKVDVRKAAAELQGRFGVPRDKLDLSRKGDTFRIWVGPFETKDQAFHFHESYRLDLFNHAGLSPFMPGAFTNETPPGG